MYNTQVEPEKILEFCIQDGMPCYRVRWCDSWISQDSLSHTWQHLIDNFWKSQSEQPNEAGKYMSSMANRFLPNFASMLANNYGNNHHPLVGAHHPSTNDYLSPGAHHHGSSEPHAQSLSNFHHISTSSHHLPNNNSHHNSTGSHHIPNSIHMANTEAVSSMNNPLVRPPHHTDTIGLPSSIADFHINPVSTPSYNDLPKTKAVPKIPLNPLNQRQVTAKKILSNAKTRVVRKVKQKTDVEMAASSDGVTCSVCNRDFSRTAKPKKRLREHFRRIHLKNGKFKCSQCAKTFVCQQGLRDHEPVHSKERNHQCRYCNETFLRLSHLYVHLRTHEEERNFRCEACFKTFSVQSELKEHCTDAHNTITADLKCGVCKQNLYSATSVYSHSLRHAGTRDHKCDLCGMAFKRKQILNQHKKRHEQDVQERKTLECDVCKKVFATKSSLRDHMFLVHQTSLEQTDHKCEVCGKCFRNWANYHRHVLLHPKISDEVSSQKAKEQEIAVLEKYNVEDTKKHQLVCNVCNNVEETVKEFIDHLQCHLVSVPTQVVNTLEGSSGSNTNLSCTVCNKTFTKLKYLRGHMDIHSSIELKCDVCGMVFKRRDTLRIHKKRHAVRKENVDNFRSRVGEIYNNRKELREKIGVADKDGRVSCPYCQKVFSKRKLLLAHIVLHGNLFYTCDICGKSYKQRSCLNKHKKSHSAVEEVDLGPKKTTASSKKDDSTRKKFKCNVCNRTYAYKKRLDEHKKIHKNEYDSEYDSEAEEIALLDELNDTPSTVKHKCHICKQGFQREESLSRHIKVTHNNLKTAINKDELDESSSIEIRNIPVDEVTPDKLNATDADISVGSNTCKSCDKTFSTKKRLRCHMESHDDTPRPCSVCDKVYQRKDTLSRHMIQVHGIRKWSKNSKQVSKVDQDNDVEESIIVLVNQIDAPDEEISATEVVTNTSDSIDDDNRKEENASRQLLEMSKQILGVTNDATTEENILHDATNNEI